MELSTNERTFEQENTSEPKPIPPRFVALSKANTIDAASLENFADNNVGVGGS